MRKKVYIITVYNSLNSGSFLQATSLYRSIESLGFEVAFIDANIRNLWKSAMIESIYMLKNWDIKSAFGKYKMAAKLSKELRDFKVVPIGKVNKKDKNSLYVLGSDEIWNVARKNMREFPILWGEGLELNQCISFAPSLNNATQEQLASLPFVRNALGHMKSISVRDAYSLSTLQELTERDIIEVCDPTILMNQQYYKDKLLEPKEKGYILVYVYSKNIGQDEIQQLKEFAKEENKELIAFGSNMQWCDKNVTGTPWNFLSYIYYADYVCTSTFHGTLFSSYFEKQFAVVGNKNRKVGELLDKFGLDRKTDASGLKYMLKKDYNKENLKTKIEELRAFGLSYLKNNIE